MITDGSGDRRFGGFCCSCFRQGGGVLEVILGPMLSAIWSLEWLRPAVVATTFALICEAVRLGLKLCGKQPRLCFDRVMAWWLALGQEAGTILRFALVLFSTLVTGEPFDYMVRLELMILSLVMFQAARDKVVALPIGLSGWQMIKRTAQLSLELTRALACLIIGILSWVTPIAILGFIAILGSSFTGEEVSTTRMVLAMSVGWWIHLRLRHHTQEMGACVKIIVELAAAGATLGIATSSIGDASAEYVWQLIRRLDEAYRVILLTLPVLSPKAIATLRAQAFRGAQQMSRQLSRRTVPPRTPEADDICAICHDSLCHDDDSCSATISGKLAHCRWGCGRAVHSECMDDWLQQSCSSAGCIFCGASWS